MKHQQLLTEGLVFFYVDNLHYEKFADGTTKEVEVPFEIPESWEWVRLSTLSSKIQYGYTASAQDNGNAKLLRITDIQNNKVEWSTVPYCDISEDKLENMKLIDNDILIARTGGTIGKSFLIRNVSDISVFASYLIRVQVTIGNLSDFVKKFIESPNYWSQLQEMSVGTGQPNVNATNLSTLLIPLPPFQEQQRIIDEINLGLVELRNIDKNQSDLKSLATQLKQKVLDVAMKGKLVPQDPNDEPASVLLEKIRAEKQKLFEEGKLKKKDLEEITVVKGDDNAYYEKLPKSWSLTALGNLYAVTSSKRVMKHEWTESGVPFYRAREIVSTKKRLALKEPIFISEGTYVKKITASGEPSTNDILVTGVGTLGITYVVPKQHKKFYFKDGNVIWLKHLGNINSKFIEKVIESPKMVKTINDTSGTTVGTLTINKAKTLLIPIPPIEEQNRIVVTIDKLHALLIQSIY
jgi:type I restriction enzyme S subunit